MNANLKFIPGEGNDYSIVVKLGEDVRTIKKVK